MIKVKFHCGMNTGNTSFTLEGYQSSECNADGVIALTEDEMIDFAEGYFSIECPNCKNQLYQSMDHFELIEDENLIQIKSHDFQVLDDIADIILTVELPKEEMEKHHLVSPTVWVTYNLKGSFMHTTVTDEGYPMNLDLTPKELVHVMNYIDKNNLKGQLMRMIFDKQKSLV